MKWYANGFERRTGIKVEVDIPADFLRLPPDVEVALFRVIYESLNNIHRYSGSPKAYVRVKPGANEITVQIGDFGKGMHPDVMNARSGKVAPLGVGIQGMRERIRQLAGKLEVTSKLNRWVRSSPRHLISQPRTAVSMVPAEASSSAKPLTEPSLRNRDASPKRILIADDHEMLRQGLRTILRAETDWEVCGEAVDGQDAVEKAVALRPDLVILDINMPTLNGLAAIRSYPAKAFLTPKFSFLRSTIRIKR